MEIQLDKPQVEIQLVGTGGKAPRPKGEVIDLTTPEIIDLTAPEIIDLTLNDE